MTPKVVLVVTGARALADTHSAEAWAKRVLRASISELPEDAIVIHGASPIRFRPVGSQGYQDEVGNPDLWAGEIARELKRSVVEFPLDGRIVRDGNQCGRWWFAGNMPLEGTEAYRRFPLKRNDAMIATVLHWAESGDIDPRGLALEAPWSRTSGARYTRRLLNKAGIPTARYLCSETLGPRRIA